MLMKKPSLNSFYKFLGIEELMVVPIQPSTFSNYNDCHNNTIFSGFDRIPGYYFIKNNNDIIAIYHSIIKKNEKYIDITPNKNLKNNIIFGKTLNFENYSIPHAMYVENSILINRCMKIHDKKFYIYALVDPETMTPFYIGKGYGDRWKHHLKETADNTGNKYKFNKIKKIQDSGNSVIIDFLITGIDDENLAYDLEKSYILKYGRKVDGGILTNICEDNRPPNHKGKTYEEIYGNNALYQKEKRYKMQIEHGGWFKGHKHSELSKQKISKKSRGNSNGNSNGLTENDILKILKDFCLMFDSKISNGRWNYFCKMHNISPNIRTSFRFNRRDIFLIAEEKFNAEIVKCDSMLWFHDTKNPSKKIRIMEWEYILCPEKIPENYVRGRGI